LIKEAGKKVFLIFKIRKSNMPLKTSKGRINKNKRGQKNTDAQWTKKGGKSHYGYKNHLNIDNAHKLVWKYAVTDTSIDDVKRLNELPDTGNISYSVWADSAYRSEATEEALKAKGYRSQIHRKGARGKPLTAWETQPNKTRSQTHCRVAHLFA
jgi:IS5 family transposase